MKNARFALEEQILDCWGICEDLDALFEGILDQDIDKDKIANIVLGLKDLYQIKFEKTFNTFERLLVETYEESPTIS